MMIGGNQPANPTGHMLRAMARPGDRSGEQRCGSAQPGVVGSRPGRRIDGPARQTPCRDLRPAASDPDADGPLRASNRRRADVPAGFHPGEAIHHFHLFCVLTALGCQEEAQVKYDEIIKSNQMTQTRLDSLAARHVLDGLAAGQLWHPPDRIPEGTAFTAMHRAAQQYRQLAAVGKRAVAGGLSSDLVARRQGVGLQPRRSRRQRDRDSQPANGQDPAADHPRQGPRLVTRRASHRLRPRSASTIPGRFDFGASGRAPAVRAGRNLAGPRRRLRGPAFFSLGAAGRLGIRLRPGVLCTARPKTKCTASPPLTPKPAVRGRSWSAWTCSPSFRPMRDMSPR